MISAGVGCSGLVAAPATSSLGDGPQAADSGSDQGTEPVSSTGSVEANVMVSGGEMFDSLDFILGNATNRLGGTAVRVGDPSHIRFSIPDVPEGAGYTLQVTGTSTDGTATCAGTSEAFAIIAQQTTQVAVSLACKGAPPFEEPPNHCPVWDTLVANPPVVPVAGGSSTLEATASSPDPVSQFAWSASAGTIHDVHQTATISTAIFTCPATSGGTVVVTLVVTNPLYPDDAGSCPAAFGHGDVEVVCPPPIPQADGGVNGGEEAGAAVDAARDAGADAPVGE
jgi:hypothetical protein